MNRDVLEFVIYIIHACAAKWSMTPKQVYFILSDNDCINGYLVPYYDILHTQGSNYLTEDLKRYLHIRGVVV